jgi:hypothetical protein
VDGARYDVAPTARASCRQVGRHGNYVLERQVGYVHRRASSEDRTSSSARRAASRQWAGSYFVIPKYTPMAPTFVREPVDRDGWVYEEMVDGWRIIAYRTVAASAW